MTFRFGGYESHQRALKLIEALSHVSNENQRITLSRDAQGYYVVTVVSS